MMQIFQSKNQAANEEFYLFKNYYFVYYTYRFIKLYCLKYNSILNLNLLLKQRNKNFLLFLTFIARTNLWGLTRF